MVYTTKYGKEYTVAPAQISDVDIHYTYISDVTYDMDELTYKNRMINSIENGYAYKVMNDGKLVGFIYTTIIEKHGEGISIWGGDPIASVAMFYEVFTQFPSHKILVVPHTDDAVYLKSLTVGYSIRNYHNHGTPLVIKISDMTTKFTKLYNQLGFTSE